MDLSGLRSDLNCREGIYSHRSVFLCKRLSRYSLVAAVSLIAYFAVGAAKSLLTIRPWWSSGLEMTLVGALEGVVTYLIGMALGRIGG